MIPLASETIPPGAALAGVEPLPSVRSRWPAIIGAGLTVAMIGGLANALLGKGLSGITSAVPTDPRFWLCFAAFYMALPVADYLIFRRLWGIPLSGLVALIKKRIANDLVVSYSGEAYFYSWARQRASFVAAPFGAIKDVSILSAMAGNVLTLLMLAAALPLSRELLSPEQWRTVMWSTVILIGVSLLFVIFSRRVFSLARRQLWEVFGVHCARVIASSTFTALAWHYALPAVSASMWLFLAAGRLLVSRLPLLSTTQKEISFFTFAALLIGQHDAIKQLIAIFAALTIAANGVLLLIFALHGLVTKRKPW